MSYERVSGLGAASLMAKSVSRSASAPLSRPPSETGKKTLPLPSFGFKQSDTTKKAVSASIKADKGKKKASVTAGRVRNIKGARNAALSRLANAKTSGASNAEVSALQKKIDELNMALAQAQKDHAAAVQAAAALHKQEVAALQKQIDDLVASIKAAKEITPDTAYTILPLPPMPDKTPPEIEALKDTVVTLQQQQDEASTQAQSEEQEAAEASAEAAQLTTEVPWHVKYRTWLYVGGAAAVLGAAYYYFMRPQTAMKLPVPTSPRSPSGLAGNPSRRVMEYAGGDEKFAAWLDKVDRIVMSKVGLSVFDLEDFPFWDSYEAGESPQSFVREVIAESVRGEYGPDFGDLFMNKKGRGRR